MNDGQLIQRLRSLDAPAGPDPAFADALFATLRAEAASRPGRLHPRSGTALAFAASAAVVLVAVGVAIGLLLGGTPGPASPTTAPFITPSMSPSAGGTDDATRVPVAAGAWRAGADPPWKSVANVVGFRDGEVWATAVTDDSLQSEAPEWRLITYDPSADEWTDREPAPAAGWLAMDAAGEVIQFGHSGRERVAWRVGSDSPDPTPFGPTGPLEFWGRPQIAPDGRFYALEAVWPSVTTGVTVVAYDPASHTFSDLPPVQTERIRPLLAVDPAGPVYLIGGWETGRRETEPGQPLRSVERYDPTTGEWSAAPDLPVGSAVGGSRYGHVAKFGADGALYVFSFVGSAGGLQGAGETSVYRLDPTTDVWTAIDPPPTGFEPHDAVLTDQGSIVLVGHVADGAQLVDPATWIWTPAE